ncbi:MAG: hypothetical protein IPK74_11965 [Deltaproteobacteria bacterium]|nr:hypothetical protein [Deltaproteobacteria bacterium]
MRRSSSSSSPTGLFYTDSARKLLAAKQFAGCIEGEHEGFVSGAAVLEVPPRASLLAVAAALGSSVLLAAPVGLRRRNGGDVGRRTRTATIVAWLLMTSLTGRNPIYWTGADVVYKAFFFLLVLSRSGHAYSVDNWLRCRKLRRAGRLRTREHQADTTREPIHRRIPAWPRMLMILQLATVYLYTGSAKTGGIWAAGDSPSTTRSTSITSIACRRS